MEKNWLKDIAFETRTVVDPKVKRYITSNWRKVIKICFNDENKAKRLAQAISTENLEKIMEII